MSSQEIARRLQFQLPSAYSIHLLLLLLLRDYEERHVLT
jgi:hypothetical protein